MASVQTTIPSFHVKSGTDTSTSRQIDPNGQGWTNVLIELNTSSWAQTDVVTVSTQFSPDGGVTWYSGPSATGHGGTQTHKDGTTSAYLGCGGTLPSACSPTNASTLGMAVLTVPSAGTTDGTITMSN